MHRVIRAVYATIAIACHPLANAHDLKATANLVAILPPRNVAWFIRLAVYMLRLTQAWRGSTSDHIIIFDQGFIQAVCSLALYNRAADEASLVRALNAIPVADLLIRLDCPQKLLEARLNHRLRSERFMERLFEGDLRTNLQLPSIVDRASTLLRTRGHSIVCINSVDQHSLNEVLDRIEEDILAKRDTKRKIAAMQRTYAAQADNKDPLDARVASSAHIASAAAPSESQVEEATEVSDPGLARRLTLQVGDTHSDDYRMSHQSAGYGVYYNRTYQSGYYAALWRKIEKPLIENILRGIGGPDRKCLDFACGTGRITNIAAPFFGEVVGTDVSESMLACARVPENVRLRRVDIIKKHLGETFDVITAFRFFLNAEDALKREALLAIYRHLCDRGWLVCNIHMNASSPVGLAHRIVARIIQRPVQNTLDLDQFTKLLLEAGFAIDDTMAYGYLVRPGRFMPGLCEAMIEPTEKACKALKIPARFAQNFLVVARKR